MDEDPVDRAERLEVEEHRAQNFLLKARELADLLKDWGNSLEARILELADENEELRKRVATLADENEELRALLRRPRAADSRP